MRWWGNNSTGLCITISFLSWKGNWGENVLLWILNLQGIFTKKQTWSESGKGDEKDKPEEIFRKEDLEAKIVFCYFSLLVEVY